MSIAEKLLALNTAKQNIKQAIIDKGVNVTEVPFTDYHTKIAEISGEGGGTPTTGDYRVRFIDYDGTVLKEEWVNEGGNATPPELLEHDLLTFQEWNNPYTNITHDQDVGAVYTTSDGKTHAFITLTKVSGKNSVGIYGIKDDDSQLTIDWGDGYQQTTTTVGSFYAYKNYVLYGDYDITLWISSGNGSYSLGGGDENTKFIGINKTNYFNITKKVFVGNNVSGITAKTFYNCNSLQLITLSKDIGFIGESAFYENGALQAVVIPQSITEIMTSCFIGCYSLTKSCIPNNIQNFNRSCFNKNHVNDSVIVINNALNIGSNALNSSGLKIILLSDNLTSIGTSAFVRVNTDKILIIPNGITEIPSGAFQGITTVESIILPNNLASIGDNAFSSCYLKEITIPASVTSIGASIGGFSTCYSMEKIIFLGATPPALTDSPPIMLTPFIKIYVPNDSLNAYKTATNWVIIADYIYPMSELT